MDIDWSSNGIVYTSEFCIHNVIRSDVIILNSELSRNTRRSTSRLISALFR